MNILNRLKQLGMIASVLFMTTQCSGMQAGSPVTSIDQLVSGTIVAIQDSQSLKYVGPSIETEQGYTMPSPSQWLSVNSEDCLLPRSQFKVTVNNDGTISFQCQDPTANFNIESVAGPAVPPNPAWIVDVANLFPNNQKWTVTFNGTATYIQNMATGGCLINFGATATTPGSGRLRTGYPNKANPGDPGTSFQIVVIALAPSVVEQEAAAAQAAAAQAAAAQAAAAQAAAAQAAAAQAAAAQAAAAQAAAAQAAAAQAAAAQAAAPTPVPVVVTPAPPSKQKKITPAAPAAKAQKPPVKAPKQKA